MTVTYSWSQRWGGGFMGELTIVNQTSSAVNGWQITITLPGDQVNAVWNAHWQLGGGGALTMTPASNDQGIEPGASLSVNIFAHGNTTEPTSCTFDGSACQQLWPGAAPPGHSG